MSGKKKQVQEEKYIRQRGNKFRVRYRDANGDPQCRTLATLEEARFFRDQKIAAVQKQRMGIRLDFLTPDDIAGTSTDAPTSFSELLKRFSDDVLRDTQPVVAASTRRSYRESVAMFTAYFVKQLGNPSISTINPKHVKTFAKWRQRHPKPVSNRTVQKDVVVLSRVFDYALDEDWVEENPVSRVKLRKIIGKVPKRQPVILNKPQYDLLIATCADDQTRTYIELLAETGVRSESEALWLRRDDVDLDEGFLEVVSGRDGHSTKSGKSRFVPITAHLREKLVKHMERKGRPLSPWLFCHEVTRRHHSAGERITSLRRAVKAAARIAGLPKQWHVHDCRHRRVTTWLAEGQPLALVQEWVGHSDPRVTDGYKSLNKEQLKLHPVIPKVVA